MLNAAASLAGKTHGQQLALTFAGDEWRALVLAELSAWCAEQRAAGKTEIAMEQFRAVALNQPPRPQAWGALASVACKAGIIAPLTRSDGSSVYRPAESVKTHGHPVRVYSLTGTRTAISNDTQPAEAVVSHSADTDVGEGRHGGNACELLSATASYHRTRAARDAA